MSRSRSFIAQVMSATSLATDTHVVKKTNSIEYSASMMTLILGCRAPEALEELEAIQAAHDTTKQDTVCDVQWDDRISSEGLRIQGRFLRRRAIPTFG